MPLLAAIQGCFGVSDQMNAKEVDEEAEGNAGLIFSSPRSMERYFEGSLLSDCCPDSAGLEGGIYESQDDSVPSPLCSLPPALDWNSDSVERKVEELKECLASLVADMGHSLKHF